MLLLIKNSSQIISSQVSDYKCLVFSLSNLALYVVLSKEIRSKLSTMEIKYRIKEKLLLSKFDGTGGNEA